MLARVSSSRKVKAKEEMVKEASRTGVNLVTTIGSQMVASMVIIVQNIIPDDNQEDARFVDLLDTILLNAPDQSSRRQRTLSMTRTLGRKTLSGKSLHGSLKSMRHPRVRKAKGRSRSRKGSRSSRVLRDLLLLDQLKPRLLEVIDLILTPNQKPDHAWRTTFYLQ